MLSNLQSGNIFFTTSAMWHGGRAFGAADAMMLTVGVVLDGGMRLLGHTPRTLPITCSQCSGREERLGRVLSARLLREESDGLQGNRGPGPSLF